MKGDALHGRLMLAAAVVVAFVGWLVYRRMARPERLDAR